MLVIYPNKTDYDTNISEDENKYFTTSSNNKFSSNTVGLT